MNCCKKGPVKVRANVDSRYYSGQYPYVSGAILGTDGLARRRCSRSAIYLKRAPAITPAGSLPLLKPQPR